MKQLFAILSACVVITSCSKSEKETETASGAAVLNVRLKDAPAVIYDSVMIDVQGVEVNSNNGNAALMLGANAGLYNLLDYANGKDTLIASDTIPITTISQIRLILGSNNYVVIGGTRYKASSELDARTFVRFLFLIGFTSKSSPLKT